jgi:hypothetical protein
MNADPRRIKELFVAALDLPTPEDRQALIERECGANAELRQRLEALLQAHDRPAPVLNQPLTMAAAEDSAACGSEAAPVDPGRTPEHAGEKPGTIVADRYKLLEQLGEGGIGTVWVAEQVQPVRRKVAVKLIKAGMDSRTVLARFDAERQALALMDHPNIAKVLDGGTTEAGRPFFVMEYVKGIPFTRYCDDARLSVAQRLALFVPVRSPHPIPGQVYRIKTTAWEEPRTAVGTKLGGNRVTGRKLWRGPACRMLGVLYTAVREVAKCFVMTTGSDLLHNRQSVRQDA